MKTYKLETGHIDVTKVKKGMVSIAVNYNGEYMVLRKSGDIYDIANMLSIAGVVNDDIDHVIEKIQRDFKLSGIDTSRDDEDFSDVRDILDWANSVIYG